jgi:SH3 domain-containing YSC84-like protein 1
MKPSRPAAAVLAVLLAAPVAAQVRETQRLEACREVLEEVMGVPEGLPLELLHKAECVAVVPSVKKAALGVGGRFGRGAVSCRTGKGEGTWGPPLLITLGGGSFGLQIGGQAADYVFFIMNPRGIDHLLKSKFTLGGDVTVAAGPKGRSAEAATDIQMRAEILTWSRSRGLFAGASLEGSVVKQDKSANRALYGEEVSPRELLLTPRQVIPPAGRKLVELLEQLSPKNLSDR